MENVKENGHLILRGDYVLTTNTEQAQVARELIDNVFEGKGREETLAEINKVINVVDFIHAHSYQDMTWLVSTLYVFAKPFAYQKKI